MLGGKHRSLFPFLSVPLGSHFTASLLTQDPERRLWDVCLLAVVTALRARGLGQPSPSRLLCLLSEKCEGWRLWARCLKEIASKLAWL